MALRIVLVDKQSPFLGEDCALCKQPLAPGDEIVICPEDAARHHAQCWRANGNKCSAYGCTGRGQIVEPEPPASPRPTRRRQPVAASGDRPPEAQSKVRTLPTSSFHCAQTCLLLSIGLAILLFAFGCFGLWAIVDYIMIEILQWPYRPPLPGSEALLGLF